MDPDADEELLDTVVQLSFAVIAVLTRLAASVGLSLTQLRVLGILRDREPRMAQLAERLGLDRSTVSGLVDRAAERGLVERTPDPDDRRASRVRLTPAGRALAADVGSRVARELAPLLDGVPAGERRGLVSGLRLLVD